MGFDFVVIGATGMQGRIVTRDLLENGHSVLMCGRDSSRIQDLIRRKDTAFEYLDLRDLERTVKTVKKSGADVVVNCAEGDWNLNALKACVKAKAHCLDLGSEIGMTKEQLGLAPMLRKKGLIHITGCGSVPGIGNVMLRHAAAKLDRIDTVEAGFVWDSNIKKFVVPFSMESIIEEFTWPAPVVENGCFVKKRPLDCTHEFKKLGIGRQKCFIVQHPETHTFYHYFKNKGLQNVRFYAGFPKHSFDTINMLIELGLGSKQEIEVNGARIQPVKFLAQVLKGLKYPEGYKEIENLWVDIYGKRRGKTTVIRMECFVPPLKGWEDAGCNIDTGMPASIMAQLVKEDVIAEKGSFAPEGIVPPEPFFRELAKRKMVVYENGKRIN